MHCTSAQGKMQSPLFSVALQNRLKAGSVTLQSHLWSFALHTGVQGASTNAVQPLFRAKCDPIVQCCSAKQAQSRQCVTAVTPMEVCSSYRCAVSQHKCSAALLKAKCNPHCSVLPCKTGSKQAVCHCNHTYGVLLFIQVCREPAQMQCSSAQGKMQSPLFSVALQSRLTAGSVSLQLHLCRFALHTGVQGASTNAVQLCSRQNAIPIVQCCPAKQAQSRQCVTAITPMEFCSSYRCAGSQHKCSAAFVQGKMRSHCSVLLCKTGSKQAVCHCSYTYGGLLFIQVCSEPAQMQCSSAQGKMQSPLFSVALQNRLKAGSVSLQSHLWSFALHTGVQGASTNAVQLCSRQNAVPTVQCCPAKQAHGRQCVTAITPIEFCSSHRWARSQQECTAPLLKAKCNPHCSVLPCKTGSKQAV